MLIHCHRHSEDSLLDGLGTAKQYAERAAELGQWALALTDHATLAGTLKHIEACGAAGIVPICGVEAYFRDDRLVRDDKDALWSYSHLVLLAKDHRGWLNLMRATSKAYTEGFYGKPALDWNVLEECGEGLIATTSCVAGQLPKSVLKGDDDGAERYLRRMQGIFGDDLYVSVQPHDFDDQRVVNVEAVRMAKQLGIPLVAEVDAHYPYREWHDTHDVVWLISTASSRGDMERARKANQEKGLGDDVFVPGSSGEPTLYLMSEEEARDAFQRFHPDLAEWAVDEAIENTERIAKSVTPFLIDTSMKVPRPKGHAYAAEQAVRNWVREGLERVGKVGEPVYEERVRYELEVWAEKDVFGYFYVIGELVRWAKEEGIRVGPGRGSAAGSLCLYLMGVTGLDPIAHGLFFERFMNPNRSDMPDVDVDFQHNRIDEVRQHLRDVWGEDNVAQIGAHQRFQPRAAVRAVSIALDVPWEEHQGATKAMDDGGAGLTLAQFEDTDPRLRKFFEKHPEVKLHASRLEGGIARLAKHPAGMVVMDKPVFEYLPVVRKADGPLQTAWSAQGDFNAIAMVGALKLDLLSTDSLSIQQRCVELVEKHYGVKVDLDSMPFLSDPEAVEEDVMMLFGKKRCFGVFQFGGGMVQGLLADMKPKRFEDLAAANSIDRPGPLTNGVADRYARVMNGLEPHPEWPKEVWPFVGGTHGFMVFQEQVMQVVSALGGYSMAEADDVRKSLTKWSKERAHLGRAALEEAFAKLEEHAVGVLGMTSAQVKFVYEEVLAFLGYSFNKAHASGYAAQSYQDMYLKARWPDCFHAAVMEFETKQIGRAIREAQTFGVEVKPPDINLAQEKPEVDPGSIIFPLVAVRNVGLPCVQAIVELREQGGPFKSFEDFEQRVVAAKRSRNCNSRARQNLLEAGAFDALGGRDGWSASAKRAKERELLSFVLQGGATVHEFVAARVHSLEEIAEGNGNHFVAGGVVTRVHEHVKAGKPPMAFLTVEQGDQEYECVCFADAWNTGANNVLKEGEVVLLAGPATKDRKGVAVKHYASAHVVMASES